MDLKHILVFSILAIVSYLCLYLIIQYLTKRKRNERMQVERLKKQSKEIYKIEVPQAEKRELKIPVSEKLEQTLTTAEIALKPQEAVMLYLLLVLLPTLICVLYTRNMLYGLLVVAVTALIPVFILKKKIKAQQKKFDGQLGDILLIIANSMRMGFTFLQAMSNLSKEVANPAGREFRKVVRDIDLGMLQEDALIHLEQRMNSKEMRLVNSALIIQRQTGGNLADMLENLSNTILSRQKVSREIRVVTSQGRISAKVIGLVPVVLFGMLMIINPDYLLDFLRTQIGVIVVAIGFLFDLVGFLVIQKMVNMKY